VFNLRDEKNPVLREKVLTGVISVEKFATMTTEEMASGRGFSSSLQVVVSVLSIDNQYADFR